MLIQDIFFLVIVKTGLPDYLKCSLLISYGKLSVLGSGLSCLASEVKLAGLVYGLLLVAFFVEFYGSVVESVGMNL